MRVGVLLRGAPPPGFGVDDADFVKGSFLRHAVSWGAGARTAIPMALLRRSGQPPAAGQHAEELLPLQLSVTMADASLYAVQLVCVQLPTGQ